MDDDKFREAWKAYNTVPCVFGKSILTRRCECSRARRINLAEREAVGCLAPDIRALCTTLLDRLHDNARFAVQHTGAGGELPHNRELKVQCGGLIGLQRALATPPSADAADRVGDIAALVTRAAAAYPGFDALPYSGIMQSVAAFQARRKRGRRKS